MFGSGCMVTKCYTNYKATTRMDSNVECHSLAIIRPFNHYLSSTVFMCFVI